MTKPGFRLLRIPCFLFGGFFVSLGQAQLAGEDRLKEVWSRHTRTTKEIHSLLLSNNTGA